MYDENQSQLPSTLDLQVLRARFMETTMLPKQYPYRSPLIARSKAPLKTHLRPIRYRPSSLISFPKHGPRSPIHITFQSMGPYYRPLVWNASILTGRCTQTRGLYFKPERNTEGQRKGPSTGQQLKLALNQPHNLPHINYGISPIPTSCG